MKIKLLLFLLPIMILGCLSSEDNNEEPDLNNNFSLKYSFGVSGLNTYNSKLNLFTKDLICDGKDTSVGLTLSNVELNNISKKLSEINFMEYPDSISDVKCDTISDSIFCTTLTPATILIFEININNENKRIYFGNPSLYESNLYYKNLWDIGNLIESNIKDKENYKSLPVPECGYL